MADLRIAAQQALEVLEAFFSDELRPYEAAKTSDALRAALAQQAEPVAWEGWWLHHGQHNYRAKPLTSERVKELMKLAFEVGREAAPPQQAEPVDTDCHTQGICQRSGYGIPKP